MAATPAYEPTDRRPIASRERKIWQRLAAFLAVRNVSANLISILGMAVGIVAGIALCATGRVDGWQQRILWLAAAIGIQLRLLANMLDGMVAIASQRASPLGELYNELPDRVSDCAIIIGAGYAAGGAPTLGYLAACIAVVTAYVRAVGKAAGASNLFLGPMAKPHRMFTLTLASILLFAFPARWQPDWTDRHFGLIAAALAIIILGGCITTYRRVAAIVRHLRKPA
jgi:phosphatidylglycerophosphate synthase